MKSFNDPRFILARTHLVDSFLTFAWIDTKSNDESETHPSTAKQLVLQEMLRARLSELGCTDVRLDDQGYLYATFPGNAPDAPVIGLIAHVDTAPDLSGTNVQPVLHERYEGGAIALSNDVTIDPADNPELSNLPLV
jgi:tripeptide aminopeptidase